MKTTDIKFVKVDQNRTDILGATEVIGRIERVELPSRVIREIYVGEQYIGEHRNQADTRQQIIGYMVSQDYDLLLDAVDAKVEEYQGMYTQGYELKTRVVADWELGVELVDETGFRVTRYYNGMTMELEKHLTYGAMIEEVRSQVRMIFEASIS